MTSKKFITLFSLFSLAATLAAATPCSAPLPLLGEKANLTDQVNARLMKTANKHFPVTSADVDSATHVSYVSQYDIFTIGAGALVTGKVAVRGTSPAWSDMSIRGTNVFASSNMAIWGTMAIWGSMAIWGTRTGTANPAAVSIKGKQ